MSKFGNRLMFRDGAFMGGELPFQGNDYVGHMRFGGDDWSMTVDIPSHMNDVSRFKISEYIGRRVRVEVFVEETE